jgi:hypothetical protein
MNLSEKDKVFLERLKKLCDENQLEIEIKDVGVKYMVLRQNYGDKVESSFGMTRQGVRWRFHRLFNEIYVSSYETIYWVESSFGTSLRSMALDIVRERVEMRKKANKMAFFGTPRREHDDSEDESQGQRL